MDALDRLEATIRARRGEDAVTSYTASLFARGRGKIAQKLGEEAVETVIAAMGDAPQAIVPEAADLIFHLCVLLADAGPSLDHVSDRPIHHKGTDRPADKTCQPRS